MIEKKHNNQVDPDLEEFLKDLEEKFADYEPIIPFGFTDEEDSTEEETAENSTLDEFIKFVEDMPDFDPSEIEFILDRLSEKNNLK